MLYLLILKRYVYYESVFFSKPIKEGVKGIIFKERIIIIEVRSRFFQIFKYKIKRQAKMNSPSVKIAIQYDMQVSRNFCLGHKFFLC